MTELISLSYDRVPLSVHDYLNLDNSLAEQKERERLDNGERSEYTSSFDQHTAEVEECDDDRKVNLPYLRQEALEVA